MGPPVLLVHGFAASGRAMWQATGWTRALERAGRDWIAPDLPGHGGRPGTHDPADYTFPALVEDLWEQVGAATAVDVMGYSLGGDVALALAAAHPERVRRLVAGGIGAERPLTPDEARALLAYARGEGPAPGGRAGALWALASLLPGNDQLALAACLVGTASSPPRDSLAGFAGPALLFAGAEDELARGLDAIAAELPAGELLELPGRDHLTALTAATLRQRALELLASG